MNKVYLVKEVQYEWVKVVAVYSNKTKALARCDELLKFKHKPIGVINYTVEVQTVID